MVKILLSNIGGTENVGIVMMIRALVSHVEAEFFVHQLTVCRDYRRYGIKYTWKPFGFDIALDLGGDTFTLYYGALQFLRHCFHLLLHVIFHQKFCLFAQTFSSYGKFSGILAGYLMRKACFITVREKRSYEQLRSMGVNCYLAADLAFLLLENYQITKLENYQIISSSYHEIIWSFLVGRGGIWDGSRAENFKFDIFKDPLDVWIMKKRAELNLDLLHRALSD